MDEKEVLFDSAEAAKCETRTLTGWFARRGEYCAKDESLARWLGCTHIRCACGASVDKSWTACERCRATRERASYFARPVAQWDGEIPLYSEATGKYYDCFDAIEEEAKRSGRTLDDMMIVICQPCFVHLDCDAFGDAVPDGEVPPELDTAMDAFNTAMAKVPVSHEPGKYRMDLTPAPGAERG